MADLSSQVNLIRVAVPFLMIPPGQVNNGIILTVPDGTAGINIYGNPALPAISSQKFQATIDPSYYMIRANQPVWLWDVGAKYHLPKKHTLGMNFRFYDLGEHITVFQGDSVTYQPYELAASLRYSFQINRYTGFGVAVKYIHSNLTPGLTLEGTQMIIGQSLAVDLGFVRRFPSRNGTFDHFLGVSVTSLGMKIRYSRNSPGDFIPTSLNAGSAFRWNIGADHNASVSYECSKLLVPTPPAFYDDSTNLEGDPVLLAGYDSDVSVFKGLIQSFYDAPGGFVEEWHEINHSFGLVYNYRFMTAGLGYTWQHPAKGSGECFTAGLSGNFRISKQNDTRCRISVSYLWPVRSSYNKIGCLKAGISLSI